MLKARWSVSLLEMSRVSGPLVDERCEVGVGAVVGDCGGVFRCYVGD